jgi:TatD DNase family protein
MIDSHCHLADEVYAGDAAAVIARAQAAGVRAAMCILDATDEAELARAEAMRPLWPAMVVSVGVHPHKAGGFAGRAAGSAECVATHIDRLSPRGIGEIGLDYHYDFAPRDVQQQVFAAQVELAAARDLPVVIHAREADEDAVAVLREAGRGKVRGVFHCFTAGHWLATQALELGFFISFTGILTFPRAGDLREVAARVPLDRTLLETDSPFLAPVPFRGKRNEPAWVGRVAEQLAAVHHTTTDAVVAATTGNFVTLFGA